MVAANEPEPRYCYRHPDRETGLSCSECDRPICYECMTPAPVGLRCPEHSGKPQGIHKVTSVAERVVTGDGSRNAFLVTMTLIGLNVTIYLLELALGGNQNGTGSTIYYKGVLFSGGYVGEHGELFASMQPGASPGVAEGGWWRLFSAAFLHYGTFHLAANMFSLYFCGRILEQVVGRWKYALLYVVAGLAGSAGALYATPNGATAGASGAIFGVLGALLVLERRGTIATGGQVLLMIVLNIMFTFAYPGISIGGHLGGLVGGAAVMLAYVQFRRSAVQSAVAAVAIGAAAVAVAYAVV